MSYDAEVERWKKYLKHIEETRDAVKTYSGSVTAAQTKAQQAIDRWKKGDEATEEAVTDYNNAVDNYNDHLCDPIPPNGPPVMRPAHPGVFVDPGQSIRDEAEQILDGAREDLETAGDDAVGKLQNVDGAKTDAQYDFWGAGADFEGPRAKWPWSKETEDDKEFGDKPGDSPWELSLGSGSLSAWIFNSDGSWEDHYGPLGANAEYSALVGVKGDYSAKIDDSGGHAGGELFGGAKLTGKGGVDLGPLGGNVDVEGWAGAGVAGDLDFGWDKGTITVGGHGGIGWGLGGKVGGDFTVDVPELLDTGGDVISSIGGFLS